MKSKTGGFQVAEVLGECRLRDAEGQEHLYWRRDGRSLAPGYYLVHWPAGVTERRFDEDSMFEGPFGERSAAEAGLRRILALIARGDPWEECCPGRSPEPPIESDHLTGQRRPS